MTPDELQLAVETNLKALDDALQLLEPKVKAADETIKLVLAKLAQHPVIMASTWKLNIDHEGQRFEARVGGDPPNNTIHLSFQGLYWEALSPSGKLLLAHFIPNLLAFLVKEVDNMTNGHFNIESTPVPDPLAPTPTPSTTKKRWWWWGWWF
jgi:hypothetical protein